MRPIDSEPSYGRIKLNSSIHGDGAYEDFKQIASEFYEDHTYKFVALTLDGEPKPDIVTFTAEFWRVKNWPEAPPLNDPLTMEELREMDGEPVYCVSKAMPEDSAWGIMCLRDKAPYVKTMQNKGHISRFFYLTTYGSAWLAYRRRQEEGTT